MVRSTGGRGRLWWFITLRICGSRTWHHSHATIRLVVRSGVRVLLCHQVGLILWVRLKSDSYYESDSDSGYYHHSNPETTVVRLGSKTWHPSHALGGWGVRLRIRHCFLVGLILIQTSSGLTQSQTQIQSPNESNSLNPTHIHFS